MTRIAIVEKPVTEKDDKVRRFVMVRIPPKYAYLRKTHD